MGYQPYLISNIRSGLKDDVRPFLLPDDAFQFYTNAYSLRGRIYRKGGNELLGRLGIRIDTLANRTGGADVYNFNTAFSPIEPGSIIITDGVTTFTDDGVGGFTIVPAPNGIVNAPTNYATGAINITFTVGNAGAQVTCLYYLLVSDSSPCMGLPTKEIAGTNNESLVAFDRIAAYEYSGSAARFNHIKFYKNTTNIVAWTGSNSDFFASCNYQNALFSMNNVAGANFYAISAITQAANAVITIGPPAHNLLVGDVVYINNVQGMVEINNLQGTITAVAANTITVNINSAAFTAYASGGVVWSQTKTKVVAAVTQGDGIRWYDGTGYVNFEPPLESAGTPRILQGALLMFAYHDHLVCLNTIEGTTFGNGQRFAQRARYSQNGNVYYAPPLPVGIQAVNSGQEWYEIPGRGGFIDATTSEEIVSAEFIKDVLVVYFEFSTYKLVFTGNQILPFVWEKINTEIGSESSFSAIPFDKEILSVGKNGVYECDSVTIDRIDRDIPDIVFEIYNGNAGPKRVHGIRDFFSEFAYWSYPDNSAHAAGSDIIFPNKILAYNYVDENFSIFDCFYTCFGYFQSFDDLTWGTATNPFSTYNQPWNSGISQTGFPEVVAGNQQGFVFFVNETDNESVANAKSLVIQNVTNAAPSVLTVPNHNLTNRQFIRITDVNGAVALNNNIYQITFINNNSFSLTDVNSNPVSVAGYTYGGLITIIDNFDIHTKNLNPYYNQGTNARLGYSDFYVDNTEQGEITIELYLADDIFVPVESHRFILNDPNNAVNIRFWQRLYFYSQSDFVSLRFLYSSAQLFNYFQINEMFVLNAINLWMSPAGRTII